MAFNMKDLNREKNSEQQGNANPQPILHSPYEGNPKTKKTIIVLICFAVIVGAGYLLFKSKFSKGKLNPPQTTEVSLLSHDSIAPAPHIDVATIDSIEKSASTDQATSSKTKKEEAKIKKPGIPSITENKEHTTSQSTPDNQRGTMNSPVDGYTVFTGVFKKKINADREVDRLNSLGLEGWIKEKDGVYYVAFGTYPTVEAAKNEAEKRKEQLPNGFHIGKAK